MSRCHHRGVSDQAPAGGPGTLRAGSAAGRGLLAATILGTGMAFLDGTVVNIALRVLGADLDATLTQLQWVVNAYLLTLSALILVGGSLADRLGRRRIYLVGVVGFALTSLGCGLAPTVEVLIAARLLQGVCGALLTPGSLALIQASLHPDDRARAIGTWSGLTSIAILAGPFVGGWLIDLASWRWIFFINLPLAAVVVALCLRFVPESREPVGAGTRFDLPGAATSAVALAALTYVLTEAAGLSGATVGLLTGIAVLAAIAFGVRERRTAHPLVPLSLFADRVFSTANAMTLLVYGALGATSFFLTLQLQVSVGMSPLQAGLASLPITGLLIVFSGRAGALAGRIGPRVPMSLGPLLAAAGTWLLVGVEAGTTYVSGVLPGVVLFGAGLTLLVAPLTASVLAAAPDAHAGVASGINNAIARTGGLLAVAALPMAVGLGGADYRDPEVFTAGYAAAQMICAVLLALGGIVSWVGLRPGRHTPREL